MAQTLQNVYCGSLHVTTIFQIRFERSLHQTCIDSTIGVFLKNECFKSFT